MKKIVLASAIASASFGANATDFSANAALSTDYMFRGVSQTGSGPAFSGGFDVDFGNGFYLGNWNSNVNFVPGSGAQLEMDFYGGYAGEVGNLGYDIGALHYFYEGEGSSANPALDTTEIYGSLGYAGFSFGISYAVSDDYFGLTAANGSTDMGGSLYYSFGYEYAFSDKLSFSASYGVTDYDKALDDPTNANPAITIDSYSDYSIGLTYTIDKFDIGLAYIGADDDAEKLFNGGNVNADDSTEGRFVLSIGTSF